MNHSNLFFVDAECDGLYGRFLSVAVLVTDNNGNEIDRFYSAVSVKKEEITSEWVKENVFPFLSNADNIVATEELLLESFWQFWIKHRENAIAVSYIQYPVEARLFSSCVMKNLEKREYLAPFPLYDLSTLVYEKHHIFDIDSLIKDDEKLPSHDAMNDVIMMSRVWFDLF